MKLWTDRRTPDHGHPISSPCEPNGSGELKIGIPLSTPFFLYIKVGLNSFSEYIARTCFPDVQNELNVKKVQVGKDQEKVQSEKDSHSKNRGGKKPN